jgi:hypothetical protein
MMSDFTESASASASASSSSSVGDRRTGSPTATQAYTQGLGWRGLWQQCTEEVVSTNPVIRVSITKAEQVGSMLTRCVIE